MERINEDGKKEGNMKRRRENKAEENGGGGENKFWLFQLLTLSLRLGSNLQFLKAAVYNFCKLTLAVA